ncbi:GDSL-type esterase/lipase family protein [Chitinophaga sp. sic0106]|uniref:SGNH/GDSL hydrolase family protein n=1 Tax=Chitinophaga sp. sic0106 TaxID=2854785 RepID=UPI001C43ECAF|nr:GDSL-type esterase/lipase family protein [Chitinophaga sp. sic0106]MBV7534043.1 hypothetical protein [Chitinophaga sp. sic0106]
MRNSIKLTLLLLLTSVFATAQDWRLSPYYWYYYGVKTDTLQVNGNAHVSGKISAQPAVADTNLITLKQLKDTISLGRGYADAFFEKIRAGAAVTIACEGTSLTYGQQYPDGPVPGINGSTIPRAQYQYPSALQNTLQYAGINATVINRGYPGDRTIEGLTRWDTCSPVDAVIIEYCHNDAMNYASYPSGVVPIDQYKVNLSAIVERRLKQHSWVLLTLPPDIDDSTGQAKINLYKTAIVEVANKYNLDIVNSQQIIGWMSTQWVDGLHLNALANNEWGSQAAANFLRDPRTHTIVGHRTTIYPPNRIFNGGATFPYASASTGYLWQLLGNSVYPVIVNSSADLQLAIKTVNNGATKSLLIRYGNGISQRDTTIVNYTAGAITTPIAAETLTKIPVGHRLIFLQRTAGEAFYVDQLSFHTEFQTLDQTLRAGNSTDRNMQFTDTNYIRFAKNSDYGEVKWYSTGDVDNSSNLIFTNGDNSSPQEGFIFRKDTANNAGITTAYDTILSLRSIIKSRLRMALNTTDDGSTQLQVGGNARITGYMQASNGTVSNLLFYDSGAGTGLVGTFSGHPMTLFAGGNEQVRILTNGNVGIGNTSPSSRLDVSGATGYNQLRLRTSYTPTSSADTNGNTGDVSWDANYLYLKTSAGWKRTALSTF